MTPSVLDKIANISKKRSHHDRLLFRRGLIGQTLVDKKGWLG